MSDLIDRQKAINVIERMRAYIGHNMERAVGAAFIEILDDVGKDIGRLPSAQPTFDARDTQYNLPIGTDCISRQAAIDAILRITNCKSVRELFEYNQEHHLTEMWSGGVNDAIDAVIGVESATDNNVGTKLGTNLAEVGTDCISRRAAISAICNACGKIDCDKMDKCEKLQLPPANCSEFPNNSDTISRQAAITEFNCCELTPDGGIDANYAIDFLKQLPPAQPEIVKCKNCKYWVPGYITDNDDFIPPKCREWQQMVGHSSDDYCSLAERREDG